MEVSYSVSQKTKVNNNRGYYLIQADTWWNFWEPTKLLKSEQDRAGNDGFKLLLSDTL